VAKPSLKEMVARAEAEGISLGQWVLKEQAVESGEDTQRTYARMAERYEVMRASVEEGLRGQAHSASGLVGGDAQRVEQARLAGSLPDTFLAAASARAMAVSEVNASMGRIVAAPTAGAAGVLPGVLVTLEEMAGVSRERAVLALFTAAGVGEVIAARASLSGAEGGCQAETGSAAAMAAAAMTEALGGTPQQAAHAVAFTLQNMLGLVCDPIGGLVEVPCLGRNASAAAQALVGAQLALAGVRHPIPPDEVIDAMHMVGQSLPVTLRETGWGGLAATPTGRAIARRLGLWTDPPLGRDEGHPSHHGADME
jgi:L-serine dehydratase